MAALMCRNCSFNTKWKFSIEEHRKQHQNSVHKSCFNCIDYLNKHKCGLCSFESKTIDKLRKHSNLQHAQSTFTSNVKLNAKNSQRISDNNYNDNQSEKVLKPSDCMIRMPTNLQKLQNVFNGQNYRLHCTHCHYKTNTRRNLKRHVLTQHTPDEQINWLQCGDCDYKAKILEALKRHILRRHTPYNKFNCLKAEAHEKPTQGKLYNTDDQIVKWFECSDCDYKSKIVQDLKKHILHRHTSAEQIDWLKCTDCDHKAKTLHALKDHILRRHTPDEKIKWWKCSDCDYKARTRAELKKHTFIRHIADAAQVVKRFECNDCDYRSITLWKLNQHRVTQHMSDEQIDWFKCVHCDYKAKTSRVFKEHILRRHTPDEKINWLKCSECDYKAKMSGQLKKHQRRRHMVDDLQV